MFDHLQQNILPFPACQATPIRLIVHSTIGCARRSVPKDCTDVTSERDNL